MEPSCRNCCPPNDIAVQRRPGEGAKRPTQPSDRNGGLGSRSATNQPLPPGLEGWSCRHPLRHTRNLRLETCPRGIVSVACTAFADPFEQRNDPRIATGVSNASEILLPEYPQDFAQLRGPAWLLLDEANVGTPREHFRRYVHGHAAVGAAVRIHIHGARYLLTIHLSAQRSRVQRRRASAVRGNARLAASNRKRE